MQRECLFRRATSRRSHYGHIGRYTEKFGTRAPHTTVNKRLTESGVFVSVALVPADLCQISKDGSMHVKGSGAGIRQGARHATILTLNSLTRAKFHASCSALSIEY